MLRRRLCLCTCLWALWGLSCNKTLEDMKAKEQTRRAKQQTEQEATIAATYGALRFLEKGLGDPATMQTSPCDDPPLRDKYKPTARLCTRLPTIDYGYLQQLIGARSPEVEQSERWAWMRRGGVESLRPVAELTKSLDRRKAADVAERIGTGHLGVFTPMAGSAGAEPDHYEGFLVIYDVAAQKPACRVKIEFETGKIFNPPVHRSRGAEHQDSPRKYQGAFWRLVNRQVRTISKVFCTKYPS
jgi:hypothetical protein